MCGRGSLPRADARSKAKAKQAAVRKKMRDLKVMQLKQRREAAKKTRHDKLALLKKRLVANDVTLTDRENAFRYFWKMLGSPIGGAGLSSTPLGGSASAPLPQASSCLHMRRYLRATHLSSEPTRLDCSALERVHVR